MRLLPLLAAALILPAIQPADAARPRRDREQDAAWRATKEGDALSLPEIEARVRQSMGDAKYLGPEIRGGSYRLKFFRDGRVIWVDVDPRTGRILGKSGR